MNKIEKLQVELKHLTTAKKALLKLDQSLVNVCNAIRYIELEMETIASIILKAGEKQ